MGQLIIAQAPPNLIRLLHHANNAVLLPLPCYQHAQWLPVASQQASLQLQCTRCRSSAGRPLPAPQAHVPRSLTMWYGLAASSACMYTSGPCAVPRWCGCAGLSARAWCAAMAGASSSSSGRISSGSITSTCE